jgi:hypothetical protein
VPDHHGPTLHGAAAVDVAEIVLFLEHDRALGEASAAALIHGRGLWIREYADPVQLVLAARAAVPHLDVGRGVVGGKRGGFLGAAVVTASDHGASDDPEQPRHAGELERRAHRKRRE